MESNFYRRFGETLRKARTSSGLSQEDLGKAVGLNRTSISNIERGRQKILLDTFCEVVRVLRIEPQKLLPLKGGEKPAPGVDLSRYRPADRAFIAKGIGLESRDTRKGKRNGNSPLEDSETRKRVVK
jgi:transcriptional regulator with XRE-family HTH domain